MSEIFTIKQEPELDIFPDEDGLSETDESNMLHDDTALVREKNLNHLDIVSK